MADFTKRAIKASFMKLLEERPMNRITVRDIAQDCGINRNTFYYHYQDIPALLIEIIKEYEGVPYFSPMLSEREMCEKYHVSRQDCDEFAFRSQKKAGAAIDAGKFKDEIVPIDIPYPRNQETKLLPRFMELRNHIWEQVYKEYLEVRK